MEDEYEYLPPEAAQAPADEYEYLPPAPPTAPAKTPPKKTTKAASAPATAEYEYLPPVNQPGQSTGDWFGRELGTGEQAKDEIPGFGDVLDAAIGGNKKGVTWSADTAKDRIEGDFMTSQQRGYVLSFAERLRALGAARGRSGDTTPVDVQLAAILADWDPASVGIPANAPIANAKEIVAFYEKNPNFKELPQIGEAWKELMKGVNAEGSDSGVVSGAKAAVAAIPAALAGAGGSAIGSRAASAVAPGAAIPGIIGGLGGAVIGSMAGQAGGDFVADEFVPQEVKDALGMNQSQLELNRAVNPWSTAIGEQLPNLLGAKPGVGTVTRLPDLNPALAGAGLGMAMEAGSQLYEGRFDPARFAAAGAGGALMTQNRKWVDKLSGVQFDYSLPTWGGSTLSEHVTYRPEAVRGSIVDDIVNGASDADIVQNHPLADPSSAAPILENVRALASSGDILGARTAAEALAVKKNNGMDVNTATRLVNEEVGSWKNAPDFVVHESPDAATVPQTMRGRDIFGAYDKDSGQVHIFADRLVDANDARAVVFHEALGHAGLAYKYQDDLDGLLLNLYERGSGDFKGAVDDWRRNNPDAYDNIYDPNNPPVKAADAEAAKRRRRAAEIEEVLAETSEQGPISPKVYDLLGKKLRDFGRKIGMDHLEYNAKEIRTILGMGHSNIIEGKDRATGLGGVRYIYAGLGSEEANLNEFAKASKMIRQGADPEAVRRMTGWHKAADGAWRYEISDKDFDFKPDVFEHLKTTKEEWKASEVFDHPELFRAYPQLADVNVRVQPDLWDWGRTLQGYFDPAKNLLVVTPYAKDPRSTAIHELQHVVQDIEGFAAGGNPEQAAMAISDDVVFTAAETATKYTRQLAKQLRNKIDAFEYALKLPEFEDLRSIARITDAAWKKYAAIKYDGKGTPAEAEVAQREWYAVAKIKDGIENDLRKAFVENDTIGSVDRDQWYELVTFMKKSEADRTTAMDGLVYQARQLDDRIDDLNVAVRYGEYDEIRKVLSKIPEVQRQAYENLHGEVEARDVQKRLEMDAAERSLVEPMTLEGKVSPDEYVFQYETGKAGAKDVEFIFEEARQLKSAIDEEAEFWGIPQDRVPKAVRESDFRADVKINLARKGLPQSIFDDYIDTVMGVNPDQDLRFARRGTRDPVERRTEEFYQKHLSTELHQDLKKYVKGVATRPVISDDEIVARGLDMGIDIESARQWGAMPDNSDYIIALKDLMNDKAVGVQELAREMLSPKGTNAQEIELVRRITELGEIMSMFDETRNNLGRMFRSLRHKIVQYGDDFEGLRDDLADYELGDGSRLGSDEIRELARRIAEGSPGELKKVVDKFNPDYQKFADSLFYNGMFSNVQTQWNNIKGNFATLLNYMATDVGSAAIGSARKAIGMKADDRVLWSEVRDRFTGIGMALGNANTYKAVLSEFTAPVGSAHKNRWQSQSIKNLPASLVIEHGTRALQAADAFFRIVAETSNLYGGARRMAQTEAKNRFGGEFGDPQHQPWVDRRIERIMQRPPTRLLKEIQAAADKLLYQEPLPKKIQSFTNAVRSVPVVGRMLLPIVSVTTNIIKYGAEFSTLPAMYRIGKNRPTGAALDRELSRIAIGGAVTALAIGKILENEMTGLGPQDPNERAEWLLSHEPQSIKVGGEWYSYKSLDPLATYLTVMSDTIQEADRGWKKRKNARGEMSTAELALNTAGAFSKALMSNSFLSSLEDLASAENPVSTFLVGLATPFARIPFASEATILSDDYKRDIRDASIPERIANRAQAVDPGGVYSTDGRQGLPIQRDPLGKPLKRIHEVNMDDQVAQEVGRLFTETGHTSIGDMRAMRNGVPVDRDIMNKVLGIMSPALNKALLGIMQRPEYAKMTDEQKSRVLQKEASRIKRIYGKRLNIELIEEDPKNQRRLMTPYKRAFAPEELPEEDND